MPTYQCGNCGGPFSAREADRKRGWARFCSKSCKAIKQEKLTGQYRNYIEQRQADYEDYSDNDHPLGSHGLGLNVFGGK